MSVAKSSPLMNFLAGRLQLGEMGAEDWSLMFSEARRIGLLSRLSSNLRSHDELESFLPDCLRRQMMGSLIEAEGFQRDVLRELDHIQRALEGLGVPVLFLKGASYVRLNLPAAQGRIFSDIDILVAKRHLGQAESALMLGGWRTGVLDPYDQRYYREWSHEVPPMTHRRRGTTIDLHHALVMPTCRIQVDSEKMVSEAVPVDADGFWWRLRDEDIVLHAASHLMLNSEFNRGLRDLWDIDLLFRHFSTRSESFPDSLQERAMNLGLLELIQQALFLANRFFETPVPARLLPASPVVVTRLVGCAASTRHRETRPKWQTIVDMLLMCREMHLRLPNRLLAVHLVHKTSTWFKGKQDKKAV